MNSEYDHYYQEEQPPQPSYKNNYRYSDNKKIFLIIAMIKIIVNIVNIL